MFERLRSILRPAPRSRKKGLPRLPRSEDEARSIHTDWDRLNGRYYFEADIALSTGDHFDDVTFDSDTNVAVVLYSTAVVGGHFAIPIERCWIKHVPGRAGTAFLPCPSCGSLRDIDEALAKAQRDLPMVDVTILACPVCGDQSEAQVLPDLIYIGYTYAAGAVHFSPVMGVTVPNLHRLRSAEFLTMEYGDKTWNIPATSA